MENSNSLGFCPHKHAIAGLDAYYCPDCKKSFERGTLMYKSLTARHTANTSPQDQIFTAWQELSGGEWGTPISILALERQLNITLDEIGAILTVMLASGRSDFELIPSRETSRNLKVAGRRVADITFYQGSKSVHDLSARIRSLTAENERLSAENKRLGEALRASDHTIKRAKDINPVVRPSLVRVMRLVADACMSLQRARGGWLLKLGHLVRKFKNLYQIWDLLLADDWSLGDIFPPTPTAPDTAAPPRLRPRNPSIAPAAITPIPI